MRIINITKVTNNKLKNIIINYKFCLKKNYK